MAWLWSGTALAVALQLFAEMMQHKLESDTTTYNAAISACEKGGEWETALQFFGQMAQSDAQANTITFNAAIGASERSSECQKV